MSSTSVRSKNELHLSPKSNTVRQSTRVPMRLPPASPRPAGLRLFYGFDVREEWLHRYVDEHRKSLLPHVTASERTRKMGEALVMLVNATGVRNLAFGSGVIDDTAITNGTLRQGLGDHVFVPLLAVCSSHRGSYDNRPSQEEYDRVEKIIGRPAKWWVGFD